MIISRTPFRLPLGGGGTDLPEYYSRHGSFFISAAIDRYVYLTVNGRTIDRQIWLSYSRIEQVTTLQDVQHDLFRECLRDMDVTSGVEIHSVTELSGGTGMGSSGSFCVGLLNALYAFKGERADAKTLAEKAFDIEAHKVGSPVGKQDQYIAAYGNIRAFEIDRQGAVTTRVIEIAPEARLHLNSGLMLFYTGVQRRADTILKEQSSQLEKKQSAAAESLHEIKEIGQRTARELEKGNVDEIGLLMHQHWLAKKRISAKMTLSWIDECYDLAMTLGATGGKIVGAGGGGFLMLYVPGFKSRSVIRERLEKEGLRYMPFQFENVGSQIVMQD